MFVPTKKKKNRTLIKRSCIKFQQTSPPPSSITSRDRAEAFVPIKLNKKETLVRFLKSISKAHPKKLTYHQKNPSGEADIYKKSKKKEMLVRFLLKFNLKIKNIVPSSEVPFR